MPEGGGTPADPDVSIVLNALSESQLRNVLLEAVKKYADVLEIASKHANLDPNKRKIIVHGLDWDLAPESAVKSFSKHGLLEDFHLLKKYNDREVVATILYKDIEGAQKAMSNPRRVVKGKRVRCHFANDKSCDLCISHS